MLLFQRTGSINTGKGEAAVQFAVAVCQHINEHHGIDLTVHTGHFSDIGKILWTAHFENFAHYEELLGRLLEDSDYQAMVKASWDQNLFVAGSVSDQMFNVI